MPALCQYSYLMLGLSLLCSENCLLCFLALLQFCAYYARFCDMLVVVIVILVVPNNIIATIKEL